MNYIVGIGEILWDMLPEGKQLGGAPANFAFHASQAGMHGIVLSAIGFDSLGAETYDMLVKLNLDNILIASDLLNAQRCRTMPSMPFCAPCPTAV